MMNIRKARKTESGLIASLIMEAMDAECCQYLAGPEHTLEEFHQLMSQLVSESGNLYSYQNILAAVDDQDRITGICVSYDGAQFRQLREPFVQKAREDFGMDHSQLQDETNAGELYIDSLCVVASARHQGIATALLKAVLQQAGQSGFQSAGLLVDKNNPKAEKLYLSLGFQYVEDASWAGHAMKHLMRSVPRADNNQ
jgi:DNA-3-methyladenine glycosylase I